MNAHKGEKKKREKIKPLRGTSYSSHQRAPLTDSLL